MSFSYINMAHTPLRSFLRLRFLCMQFEHPGCQRRAVRIGPVTCLDYIKGFSLPIGDCSLPHTGLLMDLTLLLFFAVLVDLRLYSRAEALVFEKRNSSDLLGACNAIAEAISNASQVYFPRECVLLSFVMPRSEECQASPEYLSDISHSSASSTEASTCSVEPGTAEDLSKIVSYSNLMHHLSPILIFPSFFFWDQAEYLLQ